MQDEHGFCICADDVNVGGTVIGRINHDPQAAYAQDSRHYSTLSETQALGNAGVVLGVRLGRRLAAVRIASAPAKRIPFRDISAAFKQPFRDIRRICTKSGSWGRYVDKIAFHRHVRASCRWRRHIRGNRPRFQHQREIWPASVGTGGSAQLKSPYPCIFGITLQNSKDD